MSSNTIDPSHCSAIHCTAANLLRAARALVEHAKGSDSPEVDLRQLFNVFASWLHEHGRLDLVAIDLWLRINRTDGGETALERAIGFAVAVKETIWPSELDQPTLTASGLSEAEAGRVLGRLPRIASDLRNLTPPDETALEKQLEGELLSARTLVPILHDSLEKAFALGQGSLIRDTSKEPPAVGQELPDEVDVEDMQRPDKPTKEYCLIRPNIIRWQGQKEIQRRLWALLEIIFDYPTRQGRKTISCEWLEDRLRVKPCPTRDRKYVQNAVSALSVHLTEIEFPWSLHTTSEHVICDTDPSRNFPVPA
jgi:hypothetical protein